MIDKPTNAPVHRTGAWLSLADVLAIIVEHGRGKDSIYRAACFDLQDAITTFAYGDGARVLKFIEHDGRGPG